MDNEQKTKEWNESISPRLEAIRAWFTDDSWTMGVRPFLSASLHHLRVELERRGNVPESDYFLKGMIAQLKMVLEMPSVVEKQISLIEANKKAVPTGDAGY